MARISRCNTGPVRIVLVDDRPERRRWIHYLVEAAGLGWSVVGEAANGADAVTAVDTTSADVAIVEVQIPDGAGLAAIRSVRDGCPNVAVFACSFRRDAETISEAVALGADAYLAKPISAVDLERAYSDTFGTASSAAVGADNVSAMTYEQRYPVAGAGGALP